MFDVTTQPRPAHRPRTPTNDDAILEAYRAGTSISAIAIDHDTSRDVVRRVIRDHQATADLNVVQFPSSYAPVAPDGQVTSTELQERAGITYRQLDYWVRAKYLHTSTPNLPGSGHARFYPAAEISVARIVAALTRESLSPRTAFRIARELTDTGTSELAGITIHLPEEL